MIPGVTSSSLRIIVEPQILACELIDVLEDDLVVCSINGAGDGFQ